MMLLNIGKRKTYINQICSGISPLLPKKSQFMVQFYFEGGKAYCHSLKNKKDVDNFLNWANKTVQNFALAYVSYADGKTIAKNVKGY